MPARTPMTVARYVAALAPERRALFTAIRKILRRDKRLRESMAVNPSGDIVMYTHGERPVFALVERKDGVRLYALGLPLIRPVLETYGPKFGKLRQGVYGFRFREISDLDPALLADFVRAIGALGARE